MPIVGITAPPASPPRRTIGSATTRRVAAGLIALALAVAAVSLAGGTTAGAAIVPTVPLGTAADFAVLAGSTVTNTGPSVIDGDVGVSPGSAITGFPPGTLVPPAVFHAADAVALQAQSDLTTAYDDAAGRPLNATTPAELGGLTLVGGVYAGPAHAPLQLTGPLVLDGEGDPASVFIFQTDSTLTTASASTVSLINGAQECNVFWQVGSSATLGTGSVFVGNILALTSVTVTTGVTVHGRALARNGAATLDTDVFTQPTCDLTPPTTTTSTTVPASTTTTSTTVPASTTTSSTVPASTTTTSTTVPSSTTTTSSTVPASTTTSSTVAGATTTQPGAVVSTTTTQPGAVVSTTTTQPGSSTPGGPGGPGGPTTNRPGAPTGSLPRTGSSTQVLLLLGAGALALGAAALLLSSVRRSPGR